MALARDEAGAVRQAGARVKLIGDGDVIGVVTGELSIDRIGGGTGLSVVIPVTAWCEAVELLDADIDGC